MIACPDRVALARYLEEELDEFLRRAIEEHADACSACQRTLQELTGPVPSLVRLAGAFTEFERGIIASVDSDLTDLPSVPGYLVRRRIGAGGMGEIFAARDLELNREVALKIMKPLGQNRTDPSQRFSSEAQVASQLQHPGVPPVHAMGKLSDGRPFFAMKLVKGVTLAKLLKDRSTPSDDLPRFLHIFEQVCQAMAYAHSKCVVHRDLKPENVMVGAFGEVHVMDWGLAKVLTLETENPEIDARRSVIETVRTTDPEEGTQVGSVMGTYAYMPPEQARGDVDDVDQRSDVFSLAAILCEILTGAPPYFDVERGSLRTQAKNADLGPALERISACRAEAELVEIARAGLASNSTQRLPNAGVVAERMADYQQAVRARLRDAELQRTAAEVRAAEETHTRRAVEARAKAERRAARWRLGLVGACALLLVGAVTGGASWWQRQRERQSAFEAHLQKVEELKREFRWDEAGDRLVQAEADLGGIWPLAEFRRRLEQSQQNLDLLIHLHRIRMKKATIVNGRFNRAGAAREYEEFFKNNGFGEIGRDPKEAAGRISASQEHAALVAGIYDWVESLAAQIPVPTVTSPYDRSYPPPAGLAMGNDARPATETKPPIDPEISRRLEWLIEVARVSDPNPWQEHLRDLAFGFDVLTRTKLLEERGRQDWPPSLVQLVCRGVDDAKAAAFLKRAREAHREDFWLTVCVGNALSKKNYLDALICYDSALALRPSAVFVNNNIGFLHTELYHLQGGSFTRQYDPTELTKHAIGTSYYTDPKSEDSTRRLEAEAAYKAAAALEPNSAIPHIGLGNLLLYQGALSNAMIEFQRAADLDPRDALPHIAIGKLYLDENRLVEAEAELRKAIDLEPKLATTHKGLADVLVRTERQNEAEIEYQKAIELDPEFGQAHLALGKLMMDQGRSIEAEAAFERAAAFGDSSADIWIKKCVELRQLELRLQLVLGGHDEPAGVVELLQFAAMCTRRQPEPHWVAAVRFYEKAFEAVPTLQEDLSDDHRYKAACAAAMAATGQALGGGKLDDNEKRRLRRQASSWLRADLATRMKRGGDFGRFLTSEDLKRWQGDPTFASVRDASALAKLPEDERREWQRFWFDVAVLRTMLWLLEFTPSEKMPRASGS